MRMHRFAAIALGSVTLAACSSMSLDALKPQPLTDTVRFESEPPGAEAKVSNGQTCTTPCSLALPASGSYSVVFSLNGYEPESDNIELITEGNGTPNLRPNPVLVELTPAPPPEKPVAKKPARKKSVAKRKPVTKKKPVAVPKPAAQAAAPAPVAQSQAPAPSPWPATPPAQLPQQ